MRHIMVLNAKGGSGKTTLATNLAAYYAAVEGKEVILADMDPQGSSLAWLAARSSGRPRIKGLGHQDPIRPGRNTDCVIVDSPAAVHGRDLSNLLRRAETILIPVLPSPIDMRAATAFIKEVRASARVTNKQAKVALVANRVREYTNIWHELESFLEQLKGVPVLTHLRDSMNYIRAAERGIGIFEMAPHATQTDREQWQPIIKWLASKRSRP